MILYELLYQLWLVLFFPVLVPIKCILRFVLFANTERSRNTEVYWLKEELGGNRLSRFFSGRCRASQEKKNLARTFLAHTLTHDRMKKNISTSIHPRQDLHLWQHAHIRFWLREPARQTRFLWSPTAHPMGTRFDSFETTNTSNGSDRELYAGILSVMGIRLDSNEAPSALNEYKFVSVATRNALNESDRRWNYPKATD